MLPSHPLPKTGSEQLDKWLLDARNYLGIVAARCANCLHHRCRECLSLQARKLCFSLDAITEGRDIYLDGNDLTKLEKVVLDLFAVRTTRRGDDIPIPGLTGRNKADFLKDMEARGLLISELRVTGASGHTSRYYSLPESYPKQNNSTQRDNG